MAARREQIPPIEDREVKELGKMKYVLGMSLMLSVALTRAFYPVSASPFKLFGDAVYLKFGDDDGPVKVLMLSSVIGNPNGYSGVYLKVGGDMTLDELTLLSADFNLQSGDCKGGAPRFSIGFEGLSGHLFIYIGNAPSFDCGGSSMFGAWQSTGNLMASSDPRFDSTQLGGLFYGTLAQALALVGTHRVTFISLVVDAGWATGSTQILFFRDVHGNNRVLLPD